METPDSLANETTTLRPFCRTLVNAGFIRVIIDDVATRTRADSQFLGREAAFYFGAAVFLTMFASANLDSRMLWKIHTVQKTS